MKTFKVKFGDKTYAVTAKDEEHAVELLKTTLRTRDEASSRSTIEALISDEKAAIDAYNVAIKNEDGKLSPESVAVLRAIRDDEERHTENLYAIMAGNVTEKNLEDSIKDTKTLGEVGGVTVSIEEATNGKKFVRLSCAMSKLYGSDLNALIRLLQKAHYEVD